jgi:hypothetical protein
LLSILKAHSQNDGRYDKLYAETLNNLRNRDEMFSPEKTKKENRYGYLRPGENYHNTTTTLQKGIKAAIDCMDDKDFKTYLERTIISKKGEHEPFSYIPKLSDIAIDYWDTE